MAGFRAMFAALLLGATASLAMAEAGASARAETESGSVRLLSAASAVGESGRLRLGLHFALKPGWKIYWRTPGDAGFPPALDWKGSNNLEEVQVSWPAPHRFELAGLQNYGYAGEVILPLDARAPRPGAPVAARLAVDFLACSQICVPQKVELALDLPPGQAEPTAQAHDIGRFAALVPGDGRRHGLTLETVEAVGQGDQSLLRLSLASLTPLEEPDAFVEAEDSVAFGRPRLTLSSERKSAVFEIPVAPGSLQKPLAGAALTVTVADGLRSLEARATARPGSAAAPSAGPAPALAGMLLIALLGGLILNLMPCVLPVLSIKLLGILGHGGGEKSHVRASFLASAAGIVASFLALALLAVGLKQAGAAVGWGIQFQQPAFLSAMVVLLALFAANLWGVFEIPLPSSLFSRAGGGPAHHTVAGHFLSGAFATLLATPCSAPFLGTAVGFALARGPVEILAVFTALGVGMALPFLAVAVWPQAALRLPRPGKWMITLRKGLGLALGATGLWLLSVLAVQAGLGAALLTGGAMAAALALLALRDRFPSSSRSALRACVVALAGLAVAAPLHGAGGEAGLDKGGAVAWIRFDPALLARLPGEGKVVFVDVTADWCITCKVNKAAVVERGEVARRLADPAVVAMRADWTRPDEAVARYLASFGRYGIPFNAVYGPGAPDGIPLPELLTEAEVLAALDKAR